MRVPCPLSLMTNMQPGPPYMPITDVTDVMQTMSFVLNSGLSVKAKPQKYVSSQCNKLKLKKKLAITRS